MTPRTARTPAPTEQMEAEAFTWWLRANGIRHHHGNDNMFTRSWGQLRKMKAAGFTRGFPDFTIVLPDGRGLLFVELKKMVGGTVSPDQRGWIDALNRIDGVEARVCKGADEAIAFVQSFIS